MTALKKNDLRLAKGLKIWFEISLGLSALVVTFLLGMIAFSPFFVGPQSPAEAVVEVALGEGRLIPIERLQIVPGPIRHDAQEHGLRQGARVIEITQCGGTRLAGLNPLLPVADGIRDRGLRQWDAGLGVDRRANGDPDGERHHQARDHERARKRAPKRTRHRAA